MAPRSALVLQGGGALGAYELGAARRLYRDPGFAPDLIAGVSIGAITAVLLARPAAGLTPLQALEAFWREVTVSGWFLPAPFRSYASALGNPRFFMPRTDVLDMASWTSLYDTSPLRRTLERLVDLEALADPERSPGLLVTATDIAAGQIRTFYTGDGGMSLDHILASGSLPPSFPMTMVEGRAYWDGGVFDNTPLGAVLDRLGGEASDERTVYVVNLFPNAAPVPQTMAQVVERVQGLQFANKTAEDIKLLRRFDEVSALVQALKGLGEDHPVFQDRALADAFAAVCAKSYVRVPNIVAITRPEQAEGFDGTDFSPEAIDSRAREGFLQTDAALAA